jgi:cation diffusion facilitator family transporter
MSSMATSENDKGALISPEEAAKKTSAARLSILVAAILILLKTATGLLTGSISVWASLLDSATDLFASTINYIVVRIAARPADKDHTYGHGKAESLGALCQALAIAISGIFIIREAIHRIFLPIEPSSEWLGIGSMLISTAISFALVRRLKRVANETNSPALHSDAAHYATDIGTTLSALLALLISALTSWKLADPIISIGISIYILWSAFSIARHSVDILMDRQIDEDVSERVSTIAEKYKTEGVRGFHNLRMRYSGAERFIDLHLEVDRHKTFQEAHDLTVVVIHAIESQVPRARVHIHTDPAD